MLKSKKPWNIWCAVLSLHKLQIYIKSKKIKQISLVIFKHLSSKKANNLKIQIKFIVLLNIKYCHNFAGKKI